VTRLLALVLVLLAAGLLWLAASLYLFALPHDDPVRQADALVVLGSGPHGERFRKAAELRGQHVARNLVVSEPKASRGWVRLRAWCSGGQALCFRARPFTTRGEARQVARLAKEHGWKSIIIVTSRYHVVRARLLYERCFHDKIMVVGASSGKRPLEWLGRVVHEWGGLLYAVTLGRGC
jgi:uncharacterized SAM-binding protein YcdF (DUF218 family)